MISEIQIERLRLQRMAPRKAQQPTRQISTAHGAPHRHVDVTGHSRPRLHALLQAFQAAEDNRQHIIEIVRDSASKLPQHLHFLRMRKLLFERAPFGHIECGPEHFVRFAPVIRQNPSLVEKVPPNSIAAPPTILRGELPGFHETIEAPPDIFSIVIMNTIEPDPGLPLQVTRAEAKEGFRPAADITALPEPLASRRDVESNRQRFDDE